MKAIIISIGDEILIGQVINTNAAFISSKLNSVGIEVDTVLTVGDTEEAILKGFRESASGHDLVVVTGGLGPTHDDITRTAVCKFFQTKLVSSQEARRDIETFLAARARPWSDAAEDQTLIPQGATVMPNRHGTAPGEFFEREGRYFIVMPGVPQEMEGMMNDFVVPFFRQHPTGGHILHLTLNTTGIPESTLASRLGNIEELLRGEKLAFLPSTGGVRMRITVSGSDMKKCEQKLSSIEASIREKAGKYIFSAGDISLEAAVGELLQSRGLKLAVAESCTGGLLADKITNVPGSSAYFERGIVAYSNASKADLLHVANELIKAHGAVSKEVAEAMAIGIRSVAGVDIGVSTTGIAGPSGGTESKPVGTVWIAYSDAKETVALKLNLGSDRLRIKERASQAALELVRRKVLNLG
ncbi:MAG TPA: competence/damage-inducible protein A [Bacteroidota bacterium]|jgi:nicotinamide-nucleotide amidase|nr:competence/damage-inducible protein A [Bacteroidota bacterium]